MKIKNCLIFKIFLITIAVCFIVTAFFAAKRENIEEVYAAKEKIFSVEQVKELYYSGKNYLDKNDKNTFIEAFSYTLDGVSFTPDASKINIVASAAPVMPNEYSAFFSYEQDGQIFYAENVKFSILKRKVTVTVLLNGKTEETINETEISDLKINYDFSGAIDSETRIETVNGVTVCSLREGTYTYLPFVSNLPQTPVEKYTIVAGGGKSDYYEFIYAGSLLTIVRTLVPMLSVENEQTVLVALSGAFSSIYSLNFTDLGISKSSPEFTEISNEIERRYESSGTLLNDNEVIACYRIGINDIGGNVVSGAPSSVKLYLPEKLRNRDSYKIIALYSSGDSDIIDANLSDEFLLFEAADVGVFAVYSPIRGVSVMTYAIAILIGVAVVFVVVILFALFRKKY